MAARWTELTWKLPARAREGDRNAIRKWTSHWGERRNIEVAVWIELDESNKPREVRAGTASLPKAVKFPEEIRRRFDDANARIEIWHNHPSLGTAAGIAVPGPEDIAVAGCKGIELVGTVDDGNRGSDEPRWSTIRGLRKDTVNPAAALEWTRTAQALAIDELSHYKTERVQTKDEWVAFAVETEIAKAVIGAAEAVGLVQSKGILDEQARRRGEWIARETNRLRGTPESLTEESQWTHDIGLSESNAEGTRRWKAQTHTPGNLI